MNRVEHGLIKLMEELQELADAFNYYRTALLSDSSIELHTALDSIHTEYQDLLGTVSFNQAIIALPLYLDTMDSLSDASQSEAVVISDLLKLSNEVSKAILFGLDEQRDLPTSNRQRIYTRWRALLPNLIATLQLLGIPSDPNRDLIAAKVRKIEHYAAYSRTLGMLHDD